MENNNFIIYKNNEGNIIVDAIFKDETLWLTQKGMAKVFEVQVPAISKHLKNIFDDEELNKLPRASASIALHLAIASR